MRNTETGFFATLFHLGHKTILAITSVIFITALTLSAGCAAFYKSVKNSISLQGSTAGSMAAILMVVAGCRGRFIVAERDAKGSPSRVLWVVESIDKEKRHRDELKHRSETDSLTDINNRGSGEYKISKLLTKNAFRSGDVIMRLGGDEFVAFAVGVHSPEEGMHAINRLFKNIDDIKIKELAERKVCVSIGAYCHDGNDNLTFKDLYKLADKCTYTSKKKEGNAVTFFEM